MAKGQYAIVHHTFYENADRFVSQCWKCSLFEIWHVNKWLSGWTSLTEKTLWEVYFKVYFKYASFIHPASDPWSPKEVGLKGTS